ncbi:MAG: transglycosylase SLT domain-containing protein [Kiloniellales bacterium]
MRACLVFLVAMLVAQLTGHTAAADLVQPPPAKPALPDYTNEPAPGRTIGELDRRLYKAAFAHLHGGHYRRGQALAAQGSHPLLGKVARWLELARPGTDASFAEISAFLAANPAWPYQEALTERAEEALPVTMAPTEVKAWFGARAPLTAEGGTKLGEALLALGETQAATDLLRRTWVAGDFSRRDEAAFRERHKALLRRADDLARLDRLLWSHSGSAALRQARRLGAGYVALAEARLKLASGRSGVDAAIERVPTELRDDPGLIFERADWRRRKGRYHDVVELLDPPLPDAPMPELWWSLRLWAARQAYSESDFSVAYRIAANHGMTRGLGFAEGEFLAGWIALRWLQEPERALAHFAHLEGNVSTPISLSRGAFWAGEAARALGRTEEAQVWYGKAALHNTAYYGQLAALRLGQEPNLLLPPGAALSAERKAAFEAGELVKVARLLAEIEEDELLSLFLIRLRVGARTAADYALVTDFADEIGRPDQALAAAKDARDQGMILAGPLFPLLDRALPGQPEPALIHALIRQESGFHTRAVSRSGARGLMQLMPGTAKQVARRSNVKYSRDRLTDDPDYNLRLGRSYLGELLDDYDGSYVLALAAYNAGPSRARRWLRDYGDPRSGEIDPVDWIESIPFSETRNYVQRILEALTIYRASLKGGDGSPTLAASPAAWTTE